MTNALITGWGMYAPSRVMTNHDLEKLVDTSDEWIVSRTGIRERRIAADDETTTTLSVHAARDALAVAGMCHALLGSIKVPLAKKLNIDEARVGGLVSVFGFTLIPMVLVHEVLLQLIILLDPLYLHLDKYQLIQKLNNYQMF